MFPFERRNPLQEILDAVNGGQDLPMGGGGGAPTMDFRVGRDDVGGSPMDSLIARMTRRDPQLQEEEEEPTRGRKVLAGIKDALNAYVAARTGMAAPTSAQDRLRDISERNRRVRQQNTFETQRAAAESDRESALLEYQRLQRDKELQRQTAEKEATELRGLQGDASDLGIDPGSMTAPELRKGIAGERTLRERKKEGRTLLADLTEVMEIAPEVADRLLAGDEDMIEKSYAVLGKGRQERLHEKMQHERDLALDRKATPKPDQTDAKRAAGLKKKAESVMKDTVAGLSELPSLLKSGKLTPDKVKEIFQANLDAAGLDAESAADDPAIAAERQRVVNHWAKNIGRLLGSTSRVGG